MMMIMMVVKNDDDDEYEWWKESKEAMRAEGDHGGDEGLERWYDDEDEHEDVLHHRADADGHLVVLRHVGAHARHHGVQEGIEVAWRHTIQGACVVVVIGDR